MSTKYDYGGKYCCAGLPNKRSCQNRSSMPGITLHRLPKNADVRRQWIHFIKRHRVDFNASLYSTGPFLCSDHFLATDFQRTYASLPEFNAENTKKFLRRDAVPTVYDPTQCEQQPSSRDKRMLLKATTAKGTECKKKPETPETQEPEILAPLAGPSNIEEQQPLAEHMPPSNLREKEQEPGTGIGSENQCTRCSQNCRKLESTRRKNRRLLKNISKIKQQNRELIELVRRDLDDSSSETDSNGEDMDDLEVDTQTEDDLSDVEMAEDDESQMDESGYSDFEEYSSSDDSTDSEEETARNILRVPENVEIQAEPKFVVFYSMLYTLFSMFCFKCRGQKPIVEMKKNGTMVTVHQSCSKCGPNCFKWQSQPFLQGRHPAGNFLLSFAVLTAGASISKILLVFRHMGLCVYNARTFFRQQKHYIFPAILRHWELYRTKMLDQLRTQKEVIACGDGRFDSMGHSAIYGVYSIFCSNISKIVHFELVQANEANGSSPKMELIGLQRCFASLKDEEVSISTFVSDRHRGVAKWIRESFSSVKHFFDIWHVARTITKKLLQAAKEKDCERINRWISSIRNHLYWCATTTREGFGSLILAKWKSFMRHVQDKHDSHPEDLFDECAHDHLEKERKWIKNGSAAYDKLNGILMSTSLINDIQNLSTVDQTSCLEGYHATLNHWHPKMLHFPWLGTLCRHILAVCHFNENLNRESQRGEDGEEYFRVAFPKFKLGEEIVRRVPVPPTYGYVKDIKDTLFSLTRNEMKDILTNILAKQPKPLTSQFEERISKEEAIEKHQRRNEIQTFLHPPVEDQILLEEEEKKKQDAARKKTKEPKQRCCKKCGNPTLGHRRGVCPAPQSEQQPDH